MKNVRISFESPEGNASQIPPGYQEVECHMIFDVKIGKKFCSKARMVAGGHKNEAPASVTYYLVV